MGLSGKLTGSRVSRWELSWDEQKQFLGKTEAWEQGKPGVYSPPELVNITPRTLGFHGLWMVRRGSSQQWDLVVASCPT
jgi:hypothetical protein